MIIERVDLENVLSHRRSIVNLGKGIIAIVGPNGAGKTSIIDAITYAFFGSHSRDPRNKKDSIIRLGAHHARISVDFTHNGKRYRVQKLVVRHGRSETRLYEVLEDKLKPIATSPSTVTSELKKIIGVDPSIAERLMITRQGQIEEILVNKDKRLELINTILKLKAIEKAYDRLPAIIKLVQTLHRHKKEDLEKDRMRLKQLKKDIAGLEELKKQISILRKEIERQQALYYSLREHVEKLRDNLKDVEKRLAELEALKREYAKYQEEVKQLEKHLAEAEAAKRELEKLDKMKPTIDLKKQLLTLLRQMQPLLQEVSMLKKRVNELREEVKEKQEIKPYVDEYQRLMAFLEERKEIERDYHLLNDEIHSLERQIEDLRKRIELETRKIREEAKALLPFEPPTSLDELVESAHSLLDALKKQEESLKKEKEKLSYILAIVDSKISEIRDRLERLSTARGVCPLCGKPLSDDERIQLIRRLRVEKEQAEHKYREVYSKYTSVSRQLENLSQVISDAERLVRDAEVAARTIKQLIDSIKEAEAKLRERKSRLLEIYASYKEYEEAKERVAELQHYVRKYDALSLSEKQLERLEKELESKARLLEENMANVKMLLARLGLEEPPSIEELEEEINEFSTRYANLLGSTKMLEVIEERYRDAKRRLEELGERLQELEELQSTRRRILAELEAREKELQRREEELLRIRDKAARLEGRLHELENKRKEVEELEARIAKLESLISNYEKASKALEKIRKALSPQGLPRIVREAARQQLEHSLTELLREFNIDFDYIKLDEDYNVYLVTRAGEKSVQMLSGGERIALAIAYRLALARIIGERIESMIMDEPTVHLDEEKRRELIAIIKQGLEATGLTQLIVVTHERELEEAADKVIEVQRTSGESRVVERLPGETLQLVEA